jgi:hypothetical protein
MRTTQLREYTIAPGRLDAFAELWNRSVRVLRQKKGFTIEGAWLIPSESRFLWIVSHDGPEGWEAADRAYYDSPERKAMDPDPASFIVAKRTLFIERA